MLKIKPNKILVEGDRTAARNFIGPANSQMEILKQSMSFQNLSQGVRRVWLHEDVYVECVKCFNYQECRIWVRPQVLARRRVEVKYKLAIIIATSSENEAFAWDLETNSLLVSKSTLSEVQSALRGLGYANGVEAVPSVSVDDAWDVMADAQYDAVLNLPILVTGYVADDGLQRIYTPVYPNELTDKYEYTYHYLINPIDDTADTKGPYIIWLYGGATDSEQSTFESLTGVSWPTDDLNPQRQYLYFHSMFAYPMDGYQAFLGNLQSTMIKIFDSWEDADWAAYDDVSSSDAWISTGIASIVDAGHLLFEYVGVCSDVAEDSDQCNDYPNHYEKIFRIYHHKMGQISGGPFSIFNLVNKERSDAGLSELVVNAALQSAAEEQAQYMADNTTVTHTGSGGSTSEDRIKNAGFLWYHDEVMLNSAYGENIASADLTHDTHQAVVDAWMASTEHKTNILYSDFGECGVAMVTGADGLTYFCQTFGYREAAWPGFAAMATTLNDYMDNNFTWSDANDKSRVPKVYLTEKEERKQYNI